MELVCTAIYQSITHRALERALFGLIMQSLRTACEGALPCAGADARQFKMHDFQYDPGV